MTPESSSPADELDLETVVERPREALEAVHAAGRLWLTRGGERIALARVLAPDEMVDGLTSVQPESAFCGSPGQVVALLSGDYKFRKTVAVVSTDRRVQLEPLPER